MKNSLWWSLLILSDTAAQLLMKRGALQAAATGWVPNAFILCAYAFYLLSFVLWMRLLKDTRLFIALSGASLVYVTIAAGSHFILGESITLKVISGTFLISAGVFLVGWGNSAAKKEQADEQGRSGPVRSTDA